MSRLTSAVAVLVFASGVLAAPGEGADVRRVGVLSRGAAGPFAGRDALLGGLREAGYVVGRNLAIEYRFADGDRARLQALARALVAHKVEVIVAERGQATGAAQAVTSSIPIVMVGSSDPGQTPELRAMRDAARTLHVTLEAVPVKEAAEMPAALTTITATRRLPALCELALFADAGGLAAYGPSVPDPFRTARELGITAAPTVLVRATRVIE